MSADRQRTPAKEIRVITAPSFGVPHKILGLVTAPTYTSTYSTHRSVGSALEESIEELKQAAYDLGADAIVSAQFAPIEEKNTFFSVVSSGTAVLLPWPEGHGDPLLNTIEGTSE